MPDTTTAATPMKYALGATHQASSKRLPAISAIIGIFALQGINVVVIIVIRRSRSFSIVRDAIIPGTPQPEPISIGINDLPESPNFLKSLSIINATLDIYPQASRNARKMKRTIICGTKPKTAPTPETIPSRIKLCNQSAQFNVLSKASTNCGTLGINIPKNVQPSPKTPSFAQSVAQVPTVDTDT